jgi:SAM-dependent methyltransferase
MPLGEEETSASAGISSPEEVDVRALFERLREEVGKTGGEGGTPAARRAWSRSLAERFWPVTAERPLQRRPGPLGPPIVFTKRLLRKLMRWYVEPLAADQRTFNDATLKLLDELYEHVDRLEADAAEARRIAKAERDETRRLRAELDDRLARVERRERTPSSAAAAAPVTVAAQPAAAAVPDYFAFESRMRGSTAFVRDRQRPYVEDFREAAPVLDIGCGRGELVGLLSEAGIEARGIDADADMVAFARAESLDVEQADALAYLDALPDASLGGIFAAQVVEHLPAPALLRLLELAVRKLRPGGVLVAETINPLSPLSLRNYFADLTHAQPLVPETLALLARQVGFTDTEIRLLNEPTERLAEPDDPVLAANAARINEVLFAPLDYALVARTR